MRTIVVGAGIAGLWIAEQLAARGETVTVLERADYLGGRVITSSLGYEIGAGRIATTHRRVLHLVRRFGLTTYPHSKGSLWISTRDRQLRPNTFESTWAPLSRLIAKLDAKTLATHTLRELATEMLGPAMTEEILQQFNYRAETELMRADIGLSGFASNYVGVKGGLTQIITGLAAASTVRMNTEVIDVKVDGSTYGVVLKGGDTLECDRVVLALPSVALAKLPVMRNFKPLRHIRMEPLTRIYAKFVTAWPFKERIVTDSPLRFIIPIVPTMGIVMISYVESQDTRAFAGLTGLKLVAALQNEVDRLFPQPMPRILWAKAYEWSDGCSYWLPGDYDPATESAAALQPFPETAPNLHICGESFSMNQAWMEGALEHAAALLALIKSQR